ncbi:MAG: CheR family methyltransferase [Thermodesulfobacteriota bacterium]|nr:CheR family methyltransferase [Thermodesulfobacteriota bacterium]
MPERISENILSGFSGFVAAHMGLHFPYQSWDRLENGIRSAAPDFGFTDIESCIQWLQSNSLTKKQIEILASHLTVGETYFFREQRSFEILEEHILPELIHARRGKDQRLRIWSAACCTGEEPYSIAILLDKILPDLKDWNITILATDINPLFLKKASAGRYKEWSFRSSPSGIKKRYFTNRGKGNFEILPHIKKMVEFSYLNLSEDAYPSIFNNTYAMDIIFCRNVLMYFTQDYAKQVVRRLYSSLADGGSLIVSPVETSPVLYSQFETIKFPGAVFYRKESEKGLKTSTYDSRISCAETLTSVYPDYQERQEVVSRTQRVLRQKAAALPLEGESKKQKTSESQKTLYEEALALYEQCRYAKAAEKLIELLFVNQPDDNGELPPEKMLRLLTIAYANQGKLDDSLTWCRRTIEIDKLDPGNHYLHATILQAMGQFAEAVKSLKRAIYIDPDYVLAHFALGNLTRQMGKFKESEKYFKNAASLLRGLDQGRVLPDSEGMTAGKLREMISKLKIQCLS